MGENTHNQAVHRAGCLLSLYELTGKILSTIMYLGYAAKLLLNGDLCGFLGWIFIAGPIASWFVASLWPFFLVYWLRPDPETLL